MSTEETVPVRIRREGEKTTGLVADKNIEAGHLLIATTPIITIPLSELADHDKMVATIARQLEATRPENRDFFQSMRSRAPKHPGQDQATRLCNTFQANSILLGTEGAAIPYLACHAKHACHGYNTSGVWDSELGEFTLYAVKDIEKGEEITMPFLPILRPRRDRQRAHLQKFGTSCDCALCSLPPEESRKSDRRLREIEKLEGLIQEALPGAEHRPLKVLRLLHRQVSLFAEAGIAVHDTLSWAFFHALQVAVVHGDLARARAFGGRALQGWVALGGDDGEMVRRVGHIIDDPKKHPVYGRTCNWRSEPDDFPQGAKVEDFEDWLWRKGKPIPAGILLRDRVMFPAFRDLPRDDVLDPRYHTPSDEPDMHRALRHWCFLGEIESVTHKKKDRVRLQVRDVTGAVVPMNFYTEERGKEVDKEDLAKGHAIALMYAQRHRFSVETEGIYHKKPTQLKIFRFSLWRLLLLGDLVIDCSFMVTEDNTTKCHACNKRATGMKQCAKCGKFWYCNVECQRKAWNAKGHPPVCKMLQDDDLQGLLGLMDLNSQGFQGYLEFPVTFEDEEK